MWIRFIKTILCSIGLLICLLTPSWSLSVVTFDGLPSSGNFAPWVEDGITATGNGDLGSYVFDDVAHLDTGGTGFSSTVSFTMPVEFRALSFDILPVDIFSDVKSAYCTDIELTNCGLPYDNVMVAGYDDSGVVATDAFWMGEGPSTYLFGSSFVNLTLLEISVVVPGEGFCADSPCTHFNIENIRLQPVSLPAALPLLAGGFGILLLLSGLRRRSALA